MLSGRGKSSLHAQHAQRAPIRCFPDLENLSHAETQLSDADLSSDVWGGRSDVKRVGTRQAELATMP